MCKQTALSAKRAEAIRSANYFDAVYVIYECKERLYVCRERDAPATGVIEKIRPGQRA